MLGRVLLLFFSFLTAAPQCLPKQYQQDDSCIDCLFECATCTKIDHCTRCEGYYYLANGLCLACHPTCLECQGGGYNQCTNCPPNKKFVNGTCADRNSLLIINNQIQLKYTLTESSLLIDIQVQLILLNEFFITQLSPNPEYQIKQAPYLSLGFHQKIGTSVHDLDLIMVIFDGTATKVFDAQMDQSSYIILKDQDLNQAAETSILSLEETSEMLSLRIQKPLVGSKDDATISSSKNLEVLYAMGAAQLTLAQNEAYFNAALHKYRGRIIFDFLQNYQPTQTCNFCTDCQTSSGVCSRCQDGYYLEGSVCKPCMIQCESCLNANSCLICKQPSDSVLVYMINSKCYNMESIILELQTTNLTALNPEEIVQYSRMVTAFYGLDFGPSIQCPQVACITGVCSNSFCFCQSDSLGYFCEKPKNSQAIAQQVATSLIATIPSFNDALLKSSAMRELSYISYAMSLEERETVIKLLTFNSSFNQSENQTLFSNYATALLNLFEVHYFNKLEASNEDLFKNLESFYQQAQLYNFSISAQCNFGTFFVGSLNSTNTVVNENLLALRALDPSLGYLQLFANQNTTLSELNQYATNQTSQEITVISSLGSSYNLSLKLPRAKSQMYNETYFLCMKIKDGKLALLKQPRVADRTYVCDVTIEAGKNTFLVGHYLTYLVPPVEDDSIWSANNEGFIACMVIDGLFLFFVLFFYYQYKTDAELIKAESVYQSQQPDLLANQLPLNSPQAFSPSISMINQKSQLLQDHSDITYKPDESKSRQEAKRDNDSDNSEPCIEGIEERSNIQNLKNMRVVIRDSDSDTQKNPATKSRIGEGADQAASTVIPQRQRDAEPKILINNIFYNEPEKVDAIVEQKKGENQQKQAQQEEGLEEVNEESELSVIQKQLHELYQQRATYDIWNHHPVVSLYRCIQYHRDMSWQCYFLSVVSMTIHLQLILIVVEYEVNISLRGYENEVPHFLAFSIVAVIFTWGLMYLYGLLSQLFKKGSNQELGNEETSQQLHKFYWILYGFFVVLIDSLVSWRLYSYQLGTPDYWLASAIFSPIIDFLVFDTIFILVLHSVLHKIGDKKELVLRLLCAKGYLHLDMITMQYAKHVGTSQKS